jgi:hypothetical protein
MLMETWVVLAWALLGDSEKSCNISKITMIKRTLGVTTIHTSISNFIHEGREPQTAVFLCNEGEQTNLMHFNLLHRNSILV